MGLSTDIQFMQRALFLAERGRGTTTPNPVVGAVVVSRDGVIVGQGAHRVAGGPHAEVFALDAAGARARGGTLYCTLEPCSHTGRTGPCAERVAAAGIARVVVAVEDPNPRVAGRGFAYLRDRGVIVECGVESAAALRQNAPFFTWVSARRPHVTMKTAVSRDGFVGQRDARVMLTGAAMDRAMHAQRAAVDAIAVGSETVLVDDPRLTARLVYRERPLMRVVFDRRARTPASAQLLQTLHAGRVVIFVSEASADSARADELRNAGAEVAALSETDEFGSALTWLAEQQILSLLVEGGPALQRAMWDAGVIDRVQVVETPRELLHGVRAFVPARADDAAATKIGVDRLVEWDVHRSR